ncbi:hypothetical protein, conserved [Eimeria brunetti]|uniref:Uncharacterized protein n=1 Tax=Eimeria brunetti TaxID=51314 RepID=U6LQ49_9EIME|nr:hypothetical protein, conserved [Eimeria brunetti]
MVLSLRVRIIPPFWLLFCLLVSTSILSANSRLPDGTAVHLPSLTASSHLGRRIASPSGSFLSMALPLRSASFTLGPRGEAGTPEARPQERHRRSLSVGSARRSPSGVWNREGGMPNQLQPKQREDTQQEQNQQRQRRLGRLARLRRALHRMGGAAKEKLQRLWRRIRRGASRAKQAARHAAARVYKGLPRLRRPRIPSERAQEPTASRLAGAGLVGAAAGIRAAKETLEEAKAFEKGKVSPPVSPTISTTGTSAEEATAPPVQAEAAAPASEGLEQAEGTEEWHEAPEQLQEPSEEWYDAVQPEELGSLLALARESEQQHKKEREPVPEKAEEQEKKEEKKQEEAEELGLSRQCLKFLPRMTTVMKKLNRGWRGHCMFWSLFMRNGNFGTFVDLMQDLAVETGALLTRAEMVKTTDRSADAYILRMTLALALAEDAIAQAEDNVEEHCWFFDLGNLYAKANEAEEAILNSITPVNFFANPLQFTRPLSRLVEVAYEDSYKCLNSIQKEIQTRENLQHILASQKQKLEGIVQELLHSLPSQQAGDMIQVIQELDMLNKREACSIEQLHLTLGQGKNIQGFIADYRVNGSKWWKAQWPFKLHVCRPLTKGSSVVPTEVAQMCRDYQSSRPPKRPNDVSPSLLWMWDAGSCRKG